MVSDRNFLVEFSIEISWCEAGSDLRCAGQSVTELGVCSVTQGSSEMELKESSLWHVVDHL